MTIKRPVLFHSLLVILILFLTGKTVFSHANEIIKLSDSGSSDLRNRVVAARLMVNGKDPYFFKWKPGMSETFVDPRDDPRIIFTRVTSTPSLLLLQVPFVYLSFSTQIYLWSFVQILLLILSIYLLTTFTRSSQKKLLIVLISLVFSLSNSWLLHLSLGQAYIIYVFISLLAMYCHSKRKVKIGAVLMGMLAVLRPTYILFLLPFLIFTADRKTIFIHITLGAAVMFFLPFAFGNNRLWNSYFRAMSYQSTSKLGIVSYDPIPSDYYPIIIEGVSHLANFNYFAKQDSSFKRNISSLLNQQTYNYISLTIFLSFFIYFLMTINRYRHKITSTLSIFLLGMILVVVSELFLPFSRYPYNDIQLLTITCLLTIIVKRITLFDLIGLSLFITWFFLFDTYIIENLSVWLFISYLLFRIISLIKSTTSG